MEPAMLDMQIHDIFCIYLSRCSEPHPSGAAGTFTCLNETDCDCTFQTNNLSVQNDQFSQKNTTFFKQSESITHTHTQRDHNCRIAMFKKCVCDEGTALLPKVLPNTDGWMNG